MIFVTVGTDGPFDRLVRVVDEWAEQAGRPEVFAQIGETSLRPRHIEHVGFLKPHEFRGRFSQAAVVVSHAGMGTILSALRYRKPLLVMPRRAALGEQRNDHQIATSRRLRDMGKIVVAFDERELAEQLWRLDTLGAREAIGAFAQPELTSSIGAFIRGEPY